MPHLPMKVSNALLARNGEPLNEYLLPYGWKRVRQGKVRDTYQNPKHGQIQLMAATNRLSVFDIVLPCLVPGKGEVLTGMTHFWLNEVFPDVPSHQAQWDFSTFGSDFPAECCAMVYRLNMVDAEAIVRGCLGGSVRKGYKKNGRVAGIKLPPDIPNWGKLEHALFTPSTKASKGHDVNITLATFLRRHGYTGWQVMQMAVDLYTRVNRYLESRGLLYLDTKLEFGWRLIGDTLVLCLGDECFTCDSSRITTLEDWRLAVAQDRDPIFRDKEEVRKAMRKVPTPFTKDGEPIIGLHNLDPENPEHLEFVDGLEIPTEFITSTSQNYQTLFPQLTGYELRNYQQTKMGIVFPG